VYGGIDDRSRPAMRDGASIDVRRKYLFAKGANLL
jgi:hypothetical protein